MFRGIQNSLSQPNVGHPFLLLSVQVSTKLRELSYNRDERAVFFTTLAEQVEDFSVTLLDQINTKEEISIGHEEISDMNSYASLLDSITESAIRFSQKKVHKLYNNMAAGFKRSTKVAINSAITQQSFYIFSEAQNIVRCWQILRFSGFEKGYDFCAVWSENGYIVNRICLFWSGIGHGFRRNDGSAWAYLLFPFQMNKKERVICDLLLKGYGLLLWWHNCVLIKEMYVVSPPGRKTDMEFRGQGPISRKSR